MKLSEAEIEHVTYCKNCGRSVLRRKGQKFGEVAVPGNDEDCASRMEDIPVSQWASTPAGLKALEAGK